LNYILTSCSFIAFSHAKAGSAAGKIYCNLMCIDRQK